MDIPEGAPEATATGEEEEEEEAEEAEVATALVLESVRLQTTGIISALLSDSFDKRLCCWLHLKSIFCLLLVVVVELVAKTRDCWPALMSIIPETAVHSSTTADAIFAPSSCPKASCQGEKKTMAPAAGTHRSPGSRTIKSRHTDCRSVQKNHSSRKTEERARERERGAELLLEKYHTASPESLAIFGGGKNSHVAIFTTRNHYLLQVQNLSPYLEGGKKSHVAIFTTRNPYLLQVQNLSPYLEGKKNSLVAIFITRNPYLLQVQNLSPYLEGKKRTCRHIYYTQSLFTSSPVYLAIFGVLKKLTFLPCSLLTILIYCESRIYCHI
jgi:hypothetical protein